MSKQQSDFLDLRSLSSDDMGLLSELDEIERRCSKLYDRVKGRLVAEGAGRTDAEYVLPEVELASLWHEFAGEDLDSGFTSLRKSIVRFIDRPTSEE